MVDERGHADRRLRSSKADPSTVSISAGGASCSSRASSSSARRALSVVWPRFEICRSAAAALRRASDWRYPNRAPAALVPRPAGIQSVWITAGILSSKRRRDSTTTLCAGGEKERPAHFQRRLERDAPLDQLVTRRTAIGERCCEAFSTCSSEAAAALGDIKPFAGLTMDHALLDELAHSVANGDPPHIVEIDELALGGQSHRAAADVRR